MFYFSNPHGTINFPGNPRVDYLSLDIEGSELPVLSTLPFSTLDIRTLSVEVEHSDSKKIVALLAGKGYRVVKRTKSDVIFIKNQI